MTLAISILSLLIATALGAIRAYEFFLAKPKIAMVFEWKPYILGALEGWGLLWAVANTGRRKAVLSGVRFYTEDESDFEQGHEFEAAITLGTYPAVIEVDGTTGPVWMAEPLGQARDDGVRGLLGDGRINRCVATTLAARGAKQWSFDVPPYPGAPGYKGSDRYGKFQPYAQE
jgi:hypothetical protein